MDRTIIIKILKRNNIINDGRDFNIVELANVNPYKKNVIKIYSKVKNKSYILKKCGHREMENLKIANEILILSRLKNTRVLTPIDKLGNYFIFEDVGMPLNKEKIKNKKQIFKDITKINDAFLQNGYWWRGLASRNIFYSNGKYTLIDFEKLFKIKKSGINSRNLLFLAINMSQSFDLRQTVRYIDSLKNKYCFSNKNRKMDRVEKVGRSIFNIESKDKFFDFFDKLTISAEAPFGTNNDPFEIGHIIDETVSAEISFLWTLLLVEKRKKGNFFEFKKFLKKADEIVSLNNKEKMKFSLACLIIALGDVEKHKMIMQKVHKTKQCSNADKYDSILKDIIKTLCRLTKIRPKNLSLIARGSYGECTLTKKSDLDFEIVAFADGKINALIPIENIVYEILICLGIESDGTNGRPVEKDVIVNGESRDLFEIFEMRLVIGDKINFIDYLQKYKDVVYARMLWKKRSEYEKTKSVLNSKSVFENLRFLITRLAMMNGQEILSSKISEKIRMCPGDISGIIKDLMYEVVKIRNSKKENLEKCKSVANQLNWINTKYKLPTYKFISNE